ncbi:MAG: hypothetical protein PUG60_03240 [Lachnospiraceae bacterium]|nr:hypothetical protein [Lachnospiraceae bacterium]MDY4970469.1 hypothetical protein [Lachnospiraceae bacterium]
MDPVKAAFLQAVLNQGKDINQENLLPFLLAMQKNAGERGITFTKQETDMIYNQVKNRLSPSDRKQLELLRMILMQNSDRPEPGGSRK